MKPFVQLLLLSILFPCFSCKPASDTATAAEPAATMPEAPLEAKAPSESYVVTARYDYAAVYAGKIDYTFALVVSTGTGAFEDEVNIPMPDDLLEEDGENPKMVGELFNIYFGPDGKVQKVEKAEASE